MVGNVFNGFALKGQPDDIHEQTQRENKLAKVSPIAGFTVNPEKVMTEFINVQAVESEYSGIFSYGLEDPYKMKEGYDKKWKLQAWVQS